METIIYVSHIVPYVIRYLHEFSGIFPDFFERETSLYALCTYPAPAITIGVDPPS